MADHSAPSAVPDALDRAWRTLWQGFLLDGLASAGSAAIILVNDGDLTSPLFWSALGLLFAKSILASFVSYLARLKVPPKN